MDTTTHTNRALWQDKPGIPGSIRDSPFPHLTTTSLDTTTNTTNKILIKVQAWAINPCDHMLQDRDLGLSAATSGYYPLILGCDVAGVVVGVFPSSYPTTGSTTATTTTGSKPKSESELQTGSGSGLGSGSGSGSKSHKKRFQIGDRVFGMTPNRGFQDYVILEERLAAKIPDNGITLAEAVVFGLCSQTAAMLLFGEGFLGLDSPSIHINNLNLNLENAPGGDGDASSSEIRNGIGNGGNGNGNGKRTVLIWGGASAVGSNAIQLASAAGYEVFATCSGHNFEYVKGLGAVKVFDYKDPDVVERIVEALDSDRKECAGILMAAGLGAGNSAACRVAAGVKQTINLASSNFLERMDDVPEGVVIKQPQPGSMKPFPEFYFETTHATFEGFLPAALARGAYKVAPPPLVVNKKGLEGIQEAIDLQRAIAEKGQEGIKEAIIRARGGVVTDDMVSPVKLVVERA